MNSYVNTIYRLPPAYSSSLCLRKTKNLVLQQSHGNCKIYLLRDVTKAVHADRRTDRFHTKTHTSGNASYKRGEAKVRIELTHNGFAIRCITTLLLGPCTITNSIQIKSQFVVKIWNTSTPKHS
ncbi:hypothetical protein MIDIC_50043 [Alphaproteobacteria bacterium]